MIASRRAMKRRAQRKCEHRYALDTHCCVKCGAKAEGLAEYRDRLRKMTPEQIKSEATDDL